ncbi:BAR adaptor protein Hob1 [Sorochytrium milnesiophthora]
MNADTKTAAEASTSSTRASLSSGSPLIIRDFAYPASHPLHQGIYPVQSPAPSTTSDIDNLFPCTARALYDFDAEAPGELSFAEGAVMEVLERKYPGWLTAIVDGMQGLVPENYVAIEDMDDMDLPSDSSRRPSEQSDLSDRSHSGRPSQSAAPELS